MPAVTLAIRSLADNSGKRFMETPGFQGEVLTPPAASPAPVLSGGSGLSREQEVAPLPWPALRASHCPQWALQKTAQHPSESEAVFLPFGHKLPAK